MRSKLEEGLKTLNQEMIAMGMLCENSIQEIQNSLREKPADHVQQVTENVAQIYEHHKEVESLCLKLLILQSPLAGDIRTISSAMKMISDLRRIGEICMDMADIIPHMNQTVGLLSLQEMGETAKTMLTGVMNAFVTKEDSLAKVMMEKDDTVDALFLQTRGESIQWIQENRENGEYAIDFVMIAKYFEKIGDHCVHMGKWVRYSITGILEEE